MADFYDVDLNQFADQLVKLLNTMAAHSTYEYDELVNALIYRLDMSRKTDGPRYHDPFHP